MRGKMSVNEKIGKKIREFRKKLKMTQDELAEKTEIFKQSQISKIELGTRIVKHDELLMFAEIFKVSVNKFSV